MKNERFYFLNIEDLQNVALETIDRELTVVEIEKVKDKVGEKINWFEAIQSTILSEIGDE